MPEPALLRDSDPSIAPVLALFRVVPAPLSSAGVLGGHIPALLGAPHRSRNSSSSTVVLVVEVVAAAVVVVRVVVVVAAAAVRYSLSQRTK